LDVEVLGGVLVALADPEGIGPGVGVLADTGLVIEGDSCGEGDESAVYALVVFPDETVGGVAGRL
jgi:hypothetical protein